MSKKQKSGKITKSIFITFLLLVGFALLITFISTMLLFRQGHNDTIRVAGEIIAVSESTKEVTIVDKKGITTVLVISEDTKIRGGVECLVVGRFVYSFGIKTDDGFLNSRGIRVVK